MKLVLWLLPILMGRSSGTTKTQRDKDKDKDTNDESKLDVRRLMDNCGRGNFDYVKEQADKFGNKTVIEAKDEQNEGCLMHVVAHWRKSRCQGHAETCQKQRLDLLQFLLDNGADVDEIYFSAPYWHNYDYSALGIAIKYADVPVMKLLLDGGANVEFRDRDNRTPIFYTNEFKSRNQKERFSAMSLLLKYGANIDARDGNNETVLAMAIRENQPDWALELLKNGASFETAEASYETAEASYETAKASFETAKASYETAKASYETAKASFKTAKASFETATASFETAKALFETTKASFETAKASFEAAKENSVNYAEVRATLETANTTFETAKPSFETAEASFETATASFETAKASFEPAKASLETAKASIKTAKASLKTAKEIKHKQSKFEGSMELFKVYAALRRRIQQAIEGQTLFKTGGAGNGENASKLT